MKIPEPAKFISESRLFTKVLAEIMHGIVYCYSGNSKTTGFFVSEDGWIITAGHKVDKDFPTAEKIFVKLNRIDGDKIFESERVVSPPQGYDLLLLKVDHKPKYYFKIFKDPYLFEENWIIGFRGVANICISPSGYATSNTAKPELYYTTASIYYGNSGSPVFNRKGEVLGVAVQGIPMGDGFFVPASVVEKYIKDTLEKEDDTQ